ncbi:MAG: hypothetical protein VYE81_09540 [Planctomycetota bacterium]|nr:hypothetical protein [Planctomycetota bacterium]
MSEFPLQLLIGVAPLDAFAVARHPAALPGERDLGCPVSFVRLGGATLRLPPPLL